MARSLLPPPPKHISRSASTAAGKPRPPSFNFFSGSSNNIFKGVNSNNSFKGSCGSIYEAGSGSTKPPRRFSSNAESFRGSRAGPSSAVDRRRSLNLEAALRRGDSQTVKAISALPVVNGDVNGGGGVRRSLSGQFETNNSNTGKILYD